MFFNLESLESGSTWHFTFQMAVTTSAFWIISSVLTVFRCPFCCLWRLGSFLLLLFVHTIPYSMHLVSDKFSPTFPVFFFKLFLDIFTWFFFQVNIWIIYRSSILVYVWEQDVEAWYWILLVLTHIDRCAYVVKWY